MSTLVQTALSSSKQYMPVENISSFRKEETLITTTLGNGYSLQAYHDILEQNCNAQTLQGLSEGIF